MGEDEARATVVGGAPFDTVGLVEEFVVLTRALLRSGSVEAVLDRVVWATRGLVPGADLVSVTLRDSKGGYHTPARTDRVASDLDCPGAVPGRGPHAVRTAVRRR